MLEIPKVDSEAEEREWWYAHRREIAEWIEAPMVEEAPRRSRRRSGGTPTVSIRIDPADLARLRRLASLKGVGYQTYIKMLLREALNREERRTR